MRSARPVGEDERAEEHGDADDDERVRQIEGGPRLEVEEVGHAPEPNAVDQVGDAPTEDEADERLAEAAGEGRA